MKRYPVLMDWKNSVKASIVNKIKTTTKTIYRFNIIPIKIPMAFFKKIRKNTPTIYMEPQNYPKYPKKYWERRSMQETFFKKSYYKAKISKIVWSWCLLHWQEDSLQSEPPRKPHNYKAMVIKIVWYWHKNK